MTNKDVLKQYCNTGVRIPEYQFNRLNKSLMNTYLRKRIMNTFDLEEYEYIYLNDTQKYEYLEDKLKQDKFLNYIEFINAPNSFKPNYIDMLVNGIVDIVDDFQDKESAFKYNDITIEILKLMPYNININVDDIIVMFLKNKEFQEKIGIDTIRKLIERCTDINKLIPLLGENLNKYLFKLDSQNIKDLLTYSKNPENILKIIDIKKLTDDDLGYDLIYMFFHAKNPKLILKIFGEKLESLIKNLSDDKIRYGIWNGSNKKDIREIFNKYNIEYKQFEHRI